MPKKPDLIFYGNSSKRIGAGHIMRLLALAQCSQQKGYNTLFIYKECTPAILEKIQHYGFITQEISTFSDSISLLHRSTHLIIDDYYLSSEEWQLVNRLPLFKIIFDDEVSTLPLPADLIINAAPDANSKRYRQRASNAVLCLGPKYTVLRTEFREAISSLPAFNERNRILVIMGGTDAKNLSLNICTKLLSINPSYPISLIIGNVNEHQTPYLEKLKQDFPCFEYHINPYNVANIMKHAGLALSAAGSTLSELACLGIPTIALICADNQERTLTQQSPWCYSVDFRNYIQQEETLGNNDLIDKACTFAHELYMDTPRRVKMHEYAQAILDTNGCERILEKAL